MKSRSDGNGYYLTAEWDTDGGEKQGGTDLKTMQFGLHAPNCVDSHFSSNLQTVRLRPLNCWIWQSWDKDQMVNHARTHMHKALYMYFTHSWTIRLSRAVPNTFQIENHSSEWFKLIGFSTSLF